MIFLKENSDPRLPLDGSIHVVTIFSFKVPKREIFLTELSILSVPICIGNLRAEPKKTFV